MLTETQLHLNWMTATETNNSGLKLKEALMEAFAKIGLLMVMVPQLKQKHIHLQTVNLAMGKYTYRLKQVDFDGTFEYSIQLKLK
jgi:hypothetical protein